MLDKTKVDLNKPAFGSDAQTMSSLESNDTSVEETKQEVEDDSEEETDISIENKVPYSRFKNIHNRALEAEAEAEKWKQRAEEIEQSRITRRDAEETEEIPSYWRDLYGDNDASKKAWTIQQRHEEEVERRAYEAGRRGAEELEIRQHERIESNVASIDERFEDLGARIGRDLTANEQSRILDIVDRGTAKDHYGKYTGELMPFDYAYEILESEKSSASSARRQSRDSIASLSGTSSQGNTEVKTDSEQPWNPLERGSWRKRLGL